MMTTVNNERTTTDLIRAAVSGWLGTALEFMDFQSCRLQLNEFK